MENRYYLGIHRGHNASCALMKAGSIIYAAQEERFNRQKNHIGYPKYSIDYCLDKAGIKGRDLTQAAFTSINISSIYNKSQPVTSFSIQDYFDFYGEKYYLRKFRGDNCLDYLKWLRDADRFNKNENHFDFSYLTDEVLLNREKDWELFRSECRRTVLQHLNISEEKIIFLDHHTCHAYYAYFGSPFRDKKCIVLTMDGSGDQRNQTVWKVCGSNFELIAESNQNDLGHIYKLATLLLGMRPDQDEYKVMGLAPYAKAKDVEPSYRVLKDILQIDGMRIVHKNRPEDLFSYLKKAFEGHRFDNISGAVQLYIETIVQQLIENIYKKTGISQFVLGGGLSMNIKMNKVIADLPFISSLFVCASGGDETLSLGGCYYLNREMKNNQSLQNMYLGFDIFDDANNFDWEDLAKDYIVAHNVSNAHVAKLIAQGYIVARVHGKSEFGARALGNRSILADPSCIDSVRRINKAIKNRDFWMPFACSILEEHAHTYIHNPKNLLSPFMTLAFDTRPELYQHIRSGTHQEDKTIRPQLVSREFSPQYYHLIEEFYKQTKIPALLNTSFNLHGEPIVNNIQDALRTFTLSDLDYLFINDTLISKK
ncbi:MAG: hypothetical protein HYS98_00350 [Deltaproteobacteria bacterium]|nr:hypothetical protein [Deltaproteobacteria bacterium]